MPISVERVGPKRLGRFVRDQSSSPKYDSMTDERSLFSSPRYKFWNA